MNPDEEHKNYFANYHNQPSPETLRFMARVEPTLAHMEEKIDTIAKSVVSLEAIVHKNSKLLESIEEQTRKTNGRVNKHDKYIAYISGAIATITIGWSVFTFVYPLLTRHQEVAVSNEVYEEIIGLLESKK